MRRSELLSRVTAGESWDVIVIGSMALNYALVTGMHARDAATGTVFTLHGKAVVNATGVYADATALRTLIARTVENVLARRNRASVGRAQTERVQPQAEQLEAVAVGQA